MKISEVEITTASIKGQVVIPQNIRDKIGIKPGTRFAAYKKDDVVILEKIKTPTIADFERLVDFGVKFAKAKGIGSKRDVERILYKPRKAK